MYNTNDDDMEELFRRAAADYPLKVDGSDWKEIEKRLPLAVPPTTHYLNEKYAGRKPFWLLLLLLPLVWLCNRYYDGNAKPDAAIVKQNTNQSSPTTNHEKSQAVKESELPVGAATKHTTGHIAPSEPDRATSSDGLQKSTDAVVPAARNTRSKTGKTNDQQSFTNKLKTSNEMASQSAGIGEDEVATEPALADAINHQSTTQQSANTTDTLAAKDTAGTSAKPGKAAVQPFPKKTAGYLYAGIVAGADITMVKFSKVKNAGYSAGVLLGYQFNSRLGIESGLSFTNKYYYSDGQYFKSPYNTSARKFTTVTGNCIMLEVPVNLTYNITGGAHSRWFAGAGVSSYFMKAEKYDYTYISWGQEYKAFYNNKKPAPYLFSALNLSLGYRRFIGNSLLSIQPYYKVPLRGVGIGKLPITSFGLNVALTRKIW